MNKKKWFLISIFMLMMTIGLISPSLAEPEDPEVANCRANLASDLDSECYQYIIDGSIKITYDAFGAAHDGVTNDYLPIKEAHALANKIYFSTGEMVTVYAAETTDIAHDRTYYIGDDIVRDSNGDAIIDSTTYKAKRYGPVDVNTNVDWQGATIIIDDYINCVGPNGERETCYKTSNNSVDFTDPFFYVTSVFQDSNGELQNANIQYDLTSNNSLWTIFDGFGKETTNLKDFVDYVLADESIDESLRTILSSAKRWHVLVHAETGKRKVYVTKSTANSGHEAYDAVVVDRNTGKVKSPIEFNYDNEYGHVVTVSVFPVPLDTLTIQNSIIITRTNNYGQITRRGIGLHDTANVKLQNITHILDEGAHIDEEAQANGTLGLGKGNYYQGFIESQNVSYIDMNNMDLSPHTYLKGGTYDLRFDQSVNININKLGYACADGLTEDECYFEGMHHGYVVNNDNTKRWGLMGTNSCKDVSVTNSIINRWDQHEGVHNLKIVNTTIGSLGVNLSGNGYFYVNGVTFDQTLNPVYLTSGRGSYFNGDVMVANSTWITPEEANDKTTPTNNAVLVRSVNEEDVDFGITTYFPNLYIGNITIDTSKSTNNNFYLLRFYDSLSDDIGNIQNGNPNAYYFKDNAYFNNISINKNKEGEDTNIKLFTPMFRTNAAGFNIIHYGGTNRYNIYYNEISGIESDVSNFSGIPAGITDENNKFNIQSSSDANININEAISDKLSEMDAYFNGIETADSLSRTHTATFYYQSAMESGSATVSSITLECTESEDQDGCDITIPSEVTGSVGTYNNAYAGLSTSSGNMTEVVAADATTITLTTDTTYYSIYRTPVTVYIPTSSNSTCAASTYYRNQWFASTSEMAATVLSTSVTGTENLTASTDETYNLLYGYALKTNASSVTYSTVLLLTNSTTTTAYQIDRKKYVGTFYYNSSTAGDGTVTISAATANGYRYLYCSDTATSATSNGSYQVPSAVTESVGPYGEAYVATAAEVNSMTDSRSVGYMTLYAFYRGNVTNYYYDNSAYTSRTLYRNSVFTSTSEMKTVLSTTDTGTDNFATATGPGSSSWYGLATTATTTREFADVAEAAVSNETSLYTIYEFNVNYNVGSNVSSIGDDSDTCYVTTDNTSCTVILPSIKAGVRYTSVGWNTTSGATTGTAAGESYTVSTNSATLYANAILNGDVTDYLKGDMNDDGEINLPDVIILLRMYLNIMEPTEMDMLVGDMNNDDALGLQDVIMLLRLYLGVD